MVLVEKKNKTKKASKIHEQKRIHMVKEGIPPEQG